MATRALTARGRGPNGPWWRVEPEPPSLATGLFVLPCLALFLPALVLAMPPGTCPGHERPWDAPVLAAAFAGVGLAVTLRCLARTRLVFVSALLADAAPLVVAAIVGPLPWTPLDAFAVAFVLFGVAGCASLGTLGLLRPLEPPSSLRVSVLGTLGLAILLLGVPGAIRDTVSPVVGGAIFSAFLAWRLVVHAREERRRASARA